MALGFYFQPQSFSKERYDEVLQRLERAGAGSPPGRSYHFAFTGRDGGIEVSTCGTPRSPSSSSARRSCRS